MVIPHIRITFPCPAEIMQPEPVEKEPDDELEYLSELFAGELSVCVLVTEEDPVTPVPPHQPTRARSGFESFSFSSTYASVHLSARLNAMRSSSFPSSEI